MRTLGIDPGLTRTGYGVVEDDGRQLLYVAHGIIAPPREAEIAVRLQAIYAGVERVVALFGPAEMAVEALFFARNAQTAFRLGQARGAAIMAGVHAGLPLAEYPPARVKTAIVGRGGARKEQVAHMVRVLLALPPEEIAHDATDALAVAICHCHQRRRPALLIPR